MRGRLPPLLRLPRALQGREPLALRRQRSMAVERGLDERVEHELALLGARGIGERPMPM